MAKPSGWLLQMRPTSFYWQSNDTLGADAYQCDTRNCVRAITSIGNIPIWWAAFVAVFVVVAYVALKRDWRGWVVLAGYIGLYLPWFMYWDRTIFTFYTVAFVPFVVLALTVALGWGIGLLDGDGVVMAGLVALPVWLRWGVLVLRGLLGLTPLPATQATTSPPRRRTLKAT